MSAVPTQVAILSAGTSSPSSTRMLADRIAQSVAGSLEQRGSIVEFAVVEVAPIAVDIARATVSSLHSGELQASIEHLARADGIIVCGPVYQAGVSGLLKSFIDLLDNDLLIAKPVLLAATAGSSRHGLVVDEQMRSLFAYFRALTVPTSVFAGPEEWGSAELADRISRAAAELTALIRLRVEQEIAAQGWSRYRHDYGSRTAGRDGPASELEFDSPLMRLAAGGQK